MAGDGATRLAVTLTVEEQHTLFREVVREQLVELTPAHRPPVVDRAGLARELSVSVGTVDALRKRGLIPELKLCDSPRFVVTDVLAALKGHHHAEE